MSDPNPPAQPETRPGPDFFALPELPETKPEAIALAAAAPPKKRRTRTPSRPVTRLTESEVQAFFRVLKNPRDIAIFRLAYHRGLRASEIGELNYSDWDPETKHLQLRRLKGSNSFNYRLVDVEVKALQSYIRVRGRRAGPLFPTRTGKRIDRVWLHRLMRRYCALAGIPIEKAHMHTWKHTCGTILAESGADLLDIQEHLGHKNIANTVKYIQMAGQRRERFAELKRDWK